MIYRYEADDSSFTATTKCIAEIHLFYNSQTMFL